MEGVVGKDKWRNISRTTLMVFIISSMYTLKAYQILGWGMLETKNGIVFMVVTIILAIVTIIVFGIRIKKHKK